MFNKARTVAAVHNGEIYNFQQLRERLAALGHQFTSRCDTEVLPHGYEQWGANLPRELVGMFAIAVWDNRRRQLLLARDRFGKKPLLYTRFAGGFAFASEIAPLLRHPLVERTVDENAIAQYLQLGYVPAPLSAILGIRKLPPAHALLVDGIQESPTRYWSLEYEPKLTISRTEAVATIRGLLLESVKARLISDVPLGAFLSGGIDSSAVVAFMAQATSRPVRTFSVGFHDAKHDERNYARLVAARYSTDHTEIVVDSTDVSALPALLKIVGEPFADSSIIPTFYVARVTRTHVTVALNGDGGDEIFGGYSHHRAARIASMFDRRLSPQLRWLFGKGISGLAAITPGSLWGRRLGRFGAGLELPAQERYLAWTGFFRGNRYEQIAGERLKSGKGDVNRMMAANYSSIMNEAIEPADQDMAMDIALNLPSDLLVKMDSASMAASLETRSPLLDHRLAEFVARLPADWKVSTTGTKLLLRSAMRGLLPDKILTRKKMGFSAPVGAWLRGPLRDYLGDVVLSPKTAERGYVSRAGAEKLWAAHMTGSDRTADLWSLLVLETWFREVMDPAR